MSQAMMFRDQVSFRTVLQALNPPIQIQDAEHGDPESATALLARLDGSEAEDVRAMPELLVAGINTDGGLVFIKARKEQTSTKPIWINLSVPPPERFQIVPYNPPAISALLAEYLDTPSPLSN